MYQRWCTTKNSWWWAERLPETCRVVIPIKLEFSASVGFIHKESVTIHGHTIVKHTVYLGIRLCVRTCRKNVCEKCWINKTQFLIEVCILLGCYAVSFGKSVSTDLTAFIFKVILPNNNSPSTPSSSKGSLYCNCNGRNYLNNDAAQYHSSLQQHRWNNLEYCSW